MHSVIIPRAPAFQCTRRGFFDAVSRDWEQAWRQSVTPWDLKGTVCPPLVEAVEKRNIPAKGLTALLPGCGAGYECMFLRKAGFRKVVGMDLSASAIAIANQHLQQSQLDGVTFEAKNFFECNPAGSFDFVFDYLFFAAIDPPARVQWAAAVSRHQSKGGLLATLVFPLRQPTDNAAVGPPYPVAVEDYAAVLEPAGYRLKAIDANISSIKPRQGREVMVYWVKQ